MAASDLTAGNLLARARATGPLERWWAERTTTWPTLSHTPAAGVAPFDRARDLHVGHLVGIRWPDGDGGRVARGWVLRLATTSFRLALERPDDRDPPPIGVGVLVGQAAGRCSTTLPTRVLRHDNRGMDCELPDVVLRADRRRDVRLVEAFPAGVVWDPDAGDGGRADGQTIDVSAGGARIGLRPGLDHTFQAGDRLAVELRLRGCSFELPAEVVKAGSNDRASEIRLRWRDLRDLQRRQLVWTLGLQ